jgi:hypothetical protein
MLVFKPFLLLRVFGFMEAMFLKIPFRLFLIGFKNVLDEAFYILEAF